MLVMLKLLHTDSGLLILPYRFRHTDSVSHAKSHSYALLFRHTVLLVKSHWLRTSCHSMPYQFWQLDFAIHILLHKVSRTNCLACSAILALPYWLSHTDSGLLLQPHILAQHYFSGILTHCDWVYHSCSVMQTLPECLSHTDHHCDSATHGKKKPNTDDSCIVIYLAP